MWRVKAAAKAATTFCRPTWFRLPEVDGVGALPRPGAASAWDQQPNGPHHAAQGREPAADAATTTVFCSVFHTAVWQLTDLRGADQQQRAHVVEQLAGDVADEGGRLEPLLLRLPGRLEIARYLQKKLVQPAEWEEGGAVRQRSPTPAAMWRYNRAAASNMQVQRKVCSIG